MIESYYDRRAKNKYKPKNSKIKAVVFVDDLNMPRKDEYGSQPPLELMRQWIDTGFWYDRKKIVKNFICDMQFVGSMGEPGGGRSEISARLLAKFHLINYTMPSEENMLTIYRTLVTHKFSIGFYEEIKQRCDLLANATISLFNNIMA